jgi:hypothetical protein
MKEILYAVYGSSLLRERFMIYIKGGHYRGKKYEGCQDKSKPEDYGYMFVPYRLYFAKESPRWDDKGVAFLSCEEEKDKKYYALVRLWKINESQLKDIHRQEGKGFYPKKIHLGYKENIEIYTITGCWLKETNEPSNEYLEIIKNGIKETTNWSDEKIEEYLSKFIGK